MEVRRDWKFPASLALRIKLARLRNTCFHVHEDLLLEKSREHVESVQYQIDQQIKVVDRARNTFGQLAKYLDDGFTNPMDRIRCLLDNWRQLLDREWSSLSEATLIRAPDRDGQVGAVASRLQDELERIMHILADLHSELQSPPYDECGRTERLDSYSADRDDLPPP
jgi:hypothetical protein